MTSTMMEVTEIMFHIGVFQAKDEAGADDGTTTPAPPGGGGDKKLTNQFNFSERASQTYNNPYRV